VRRPDELSSGLGLERSVRSFVALPCPPGIGSAVSAALAEWRGLGAEVAWSDPATAHLTLRFLGDADPARLDRLHERMPDVARASESIRATPGATGAFPSWARPRVLWLGLESGGAIERLAAAVETAARDVGFEPEERRFTAHLTLGRVRGPRGLRRAADAVRGWKPRGSAETASEVVLYRSELGAGGARHVALARYPIG
jgi:2'-5' RNA ligase